MDFTGRTGTTAESGVREGAMVQTPTPCTKSLRLAIGDHRMLVRPGIVALTVRPAITALTGY